MKNLYKLIVSVIVLALESSLAAQPIYQLNENSPVIIAATPMLSLRSMDPVLEAKNLPVTFYLDSRGRLTETEVYALRKTFEPLLKIPETFPRSTIYWRYYAVENVGSRSVELIDDFRPPNEGCKTFVWRNEVFDRAAEYSSHSKFNEFKNTDPYAADSARAKMPFQKTALIPQEKLEFLVRCVPKKHDLFNDETSVFDSRNMIHNDIKLVQVEPHQVWSRWPLYLRGIFLGVLVALLCTSILAAFVGQTAQSWLLAAWLLLTLFACAWSVDFFEFFYDGLGSEKLLNNSRNIIDTIQASANLLFLYFSYFNLGGGSSFFNSALSRRLRKLTIVAAVIAVAQETLLGWPRTLLEFDIDIGLIGFYRTFFNGVFGSSGALVFVKIFMVISWVCVILLRLAVLSVALEKFRKGSRSALFILLALCMLTFANTVAIKLAAAFFMDAANYERFTNSDGSNPWFYVPQIIQALIMFYAFFCRNKEIQMSLDDMTKSRQRFIEEQNILLENRVIERTQELQVQTEKTERLMLNILPQSIAERLKDGDKEVSDKYQNTTILFSDLVGFTKMSSEKTPEELVFLLNDLFKRFDIRALSLGLEKIKTIGDAYMVVGGLPTVDDTHAIRVTKMALGMYEDLAEFNAQHRVRFDMRIGINSGPVVAGVIGHSKFSYDLWGNAVNTASRMESTSVPGKIQVSPSTFEQIKDHFDVQEHQLVECKGLGQIMTYFVNGQLPAGGPAFA